MSGTLQTPFGTLALRRRPHNPALQAWDAADEYLLQAAAEHGVPQRALVINDSFGALACMLHRAHPISWGDSFVAHLALQQNWQHNGLEGECTLLPSTERPTAPIDLVLWRVPKSQALFEQQIARLQPLLQSGTVVLAGGMDKHLLPATKQLLERLGRVDTLPGRKKSHLFRLHPDRALPAVPEPPPQRIAVPSLNLELQSDANLFAREQLDIGTRFFIDQFAQLPPAVRIADLGCGNGALMLALARQRPGSDIHGFDESYQAVACAAQNWQRNIGDECAGRFHVSDGLSRSDGIDSGRFDLILCNPPFHQQHTVGDHLARRLFAECRQHLATGGELWVVGNRHLGYRELLRERFGNSSLVAANSKFVVLRATQRAA
jgi:16S rRNA (guanine1207-N2)-methyltransferase